MGIKRLRIFAGPNGSGKSTIYKKIVSTGDLNFGIFVNADEIEYQLTFSARLNFASYNLSLDFEHFCESFKQSDFYELSGGSKFISALSIEYDYLLINDIKYLNSYFSAFVAEYIRIAMLDCVDVFTIETVMSHPSKLDYIKLAKSKGYRVYLYFVSTRNEEINVLRVKQRVESGGHAVPEEKIKLRYLRSLENLYNALLVSDRGYLFDNSDLNKPILYIEYDGEQVIVNNPMVPAWIDKYLIQKITH